MAKVRIGDYFQSDKGDIYVLYARKAGAQLRCLTGNMAATDDLVPIKDAWAITNEEFKQLANGVSVQPMKVQDAYMELKTRGIL